MEELECPCVRELLSMEALEGRKGTHNMMCSGLKLRAIPGSYYNPNK